MFMPIQWTFLLILILLLSGGFYLLYPKIENFFVFFPQKPFDLAPETLGLQYKDVYFKAVDGTRLHGWFFPLADEYPVILHFHGNAGNISHRLDLVSRFLQRKLQVFIIDYRGFGRSDGRPSEKGVYQDGLAAYDHLVQKEGVLPGRIVVHGHSIGAAVAVEVSLQRGVKSAILESAFTSTREMAKSIPLFYLLSPFLPARYHNLEKVRRLHIPKLFIHGDADEIVPFAMGEKLFEAAKEPKFFLRLPGAGHNDTHVIGGERYLSSFATFARESRI